jgi:hypothetical protein
MINVTNLQFKQAKRHYYKTFLNKHKGRLKPKAVKAQETTTRRSQCTVAQHWRWFQTFDKALQFCREMNTGLCKKSGKTFGEVIEHFLIRGDKTNLIANADGQIKIVGEFGKRKHERKVSDCRSSISMYRTGTAAGDNGPTVFIMKGIRCKSGFDNNFLTRNGCEPGLSIQNAVQTTKTWVDSAPSLVFGYRQLPYLKENPDWYAIEIFDGFSAHTASFEALQIRRDNRILCIKAEGDSSSVNQAYDKMVAKSDKAILHSASHTHGSTFVEVF